MQFGLENDDLPQLESLEAGWTVDALLNGDTTPHVFTYYTTNEYSQDADNLGGYYRTVTGWVQYDRNVYPGRQD
jgi:Neprosin